jgi:hypothetical protein
MNTRIGVLLAVLLCAGCGNDVKGTYVGGRDSLLGSMTFKDDGKVDVVLINGIGGEGTYEVDGDKVRVTANGQSNELTIGSDDCLHGPIMMGTLCQGEKKASVSSAAPPSSSRSGGGLAGSTFEARNEGGALAFQFTDGETVKVSMLVPGQPEETGAAVGTYRVSGDQVIVNVQGSPETFTLNGNTLIGNFGGEQVTFTRK